MFSGVPNFVFLQMGPTLFARTETGLGYYGLVLTVVTFLTGAVLQGVLTRASIDDLSGRRVSAGAALSVGLGLALPLVGLGAVVLAGVGLGALLLFVPGIMLAVRWAVAAPALVAENAGILGAMGRSAKLTENYRWQVFGLIAIYFIASWVVGTVVRVVLRAAIVSADPGAGSLISVWAVATTLLLTLKAMIATAGIAAVYFELRQIKEGVGITEIASVFD
jgi:hypothetical protein